MIQMLGPIDIPCAECGTEGLTKDVQVLLVTQGDNKVVECMALCPRCRVRAEAVLRASRKAGPRVRKEAAK